MKDFYNDNFKKLKEKLSKEKGTISKCDFAESINKIVTSAIGAMVFFNNMDLAFEIAALKTNEAMDELFSKEPQEEKNTKKDAKYEDLKNLIFYRSAECGVPIPGTVESNRTAEIKRHAKHEVLLSLIFNAGLTEEYRKWLWENGYE